MNPSVQNVWPDWSIGRLIGEGSFGKVYEIVRNNFGIEEHCALKVISIPSSDAELQSMKNEGMDDASATEYYRGLVEEFVQEIALMSKLKGNVNIVGYDDYAVVEHKDSIGWDILIRMELLTALPNYIKSHNFTLQDVLKMAQDLCSALEVCHGQKIIHRDIKPDNIFVSAKGDYKLGDFGVARTVEKTVSGLSKKGTYTYMAPEVYKGEEYGTNVDLYSLGIVLYKLLNNNREPFLPPHPETIKYSDKNNALVRRMSGEVIMAPANCNDFLSRVILKACSFRPADRYQSATQMRTDIQSVQASLYSGNAPVLNADNFIATANATSTAALRQKNDIAKGKRDKVLRIIANIIGWPMAVVWTFLMAFVDPIIFLISLTVTVMMILLSIRKLDSKRKVFGIIMLLFSIVSLNLVNAVAAVLFLLSNGPTAQQGKQPENKNF